MTKEVCPKITVPPNGNEKTLTVAEQPWKAFPKFYSEVMEIWSMDGNEMPQKLIAEIPMDPDDDLGEIEQHAQLLASLPQQLRTLREAPAPPDWSSVDDSTGQFATLLHWLGKEYLPWYRIERRAALAEAVTNREHKPTL